MNSDPLLASCERYFDLAGHAAFLAARASEAGTLAEESDVRRQVEIEIDENKVERQVLMWRILELTAPVEAPEVIAFAAMDAVPEAPEETAPVAQDIVSEADREAPQPIAARELAAARELVFVREVAVAEAVGASEAAPEAMEATAPEHVPVQTPQTELFVVPSPRQHFDQRRTVGSRGGATPLRQGLRRLLERYRGQNPSVRA